ncbi:MAG TPA: Crp/Fnr family transcriptional regulator [Pyrinomonadaceae bacterium]|jgi:CRP-like cAMP-binding protein|nr:Crp/Fnr family transcriptional regulator [Pyrinomonadaceae bacterium]
MSPPKSPAIPNLLLAALPKKDYQALQGHLEEIPLVFEEFLYRPGVPIGDVYFPNSGVVSLLAGINDHATLEVGLVGNEGMVGLSAFLGVEFSMNRAVVQGAGFAMKMKATALRKQCNNGGALPRLLQRYAHSVLTQISQSAVCNQFHSVDARLARWLLMTHDRMGDDEFQLTQEFLSNMLGVRREGVSKAAGKLQKRKLIRYSRGRLKVLDRPGLEATSCGCYEIIRSESNDS